MLKKWYFLINTGHCVVGLLVFSEFSKEQENRWRRFISNVNIFQLWCTLGLRVPIMFPNIILKKKKKDSCLQMFISQARGFLPQTTWHVCTLQTLYFLKTYEIMSYCFMNHLKRFIHILFHLFIYFYLGLFPWTIFSSYPNSMLLSWKVEKYNSTSVL